MHVFCGESIDFVVLMVNFMKFIKLRVNMQDPMTPIEDCVLDEVYYQHLTDEFRQRREISETVPDS